MNHILTGRTETIRTSSPTNASAVRHLVTLGISILLGGYAVWLLRQEWAIGQVWPWLVMLVAMFAAALALRKLELWLPGAPMLPTLAGFRSLPFRAFGTFEIVIAAAMTGFVAWRLWQNGANWQGMPIVWAAAILLVLFGAWLIGAVGRASPRAAAALSLWPDTPRSRWLEAAAFVLILALAVFLRTYRLGSIPPGIYVDETNAAIDALYLLEGRPDSPFGTGWYGTPNGYLYYMAGIFKLFGANWISLKIVSLIPAILTVPAVYLLGRLMFGPLAGLCAMLLMAASRWHLSMSRWGWNETAPPLFQVLAAYFLLRGLRDRRALDYALGGLLTGLSIYTYLSARLAAITLALFLLYWFLSDPTSPFSAFRRSWLGMVIFITAAMIVVAPLAVTFVKDPYSFGNRTAEISILRDIRNQGSLDPLMENVADILKFFHQTGDLQGKHNLPGEPMADPVTGLLFAVGLAYAIIRWRDQRRFLLIVWLVLGLAGSFLSSQHESPQSYRSLTALPAVVLLAADVLDRLARALYRVLQEQKFPAAQARLPALGAGALVLVALSGAAAWEASTYFGRQAASIEVVQGFNPTENRVAQEVIAAVAAGKEVYLSPQLSEYSPLRFLLYGVMKEKTGVNTLDNAPYHVLLPETNLPVPNTNRDVLMLLSVNYWPLRDYVTSYYPDAQTELVTLREDLPLYARIQIPAQQIAALQGLTQTITYADGRTEERAVSQVEWPSGSAEVSQVTWEGTIRLEHGGMYDFRAEGDLLVMLDYEEVEGKRYLGRGQYPLTVVWNKGDASQAGLVWQQPGQEGYVPVPPETLFRYAGPQQGLLGTYWDNTNWEGPPVFQQVTPFLLLSWPDEQPIVPNGPFSARYTGYLRIEQAGTYVFKIEADDGARLILDGEVQGESMTPGQPNTVEVSTDLLAGEHTIQIDYFQQGGGSALRLLWIYGDNPIAPVPPSVLTPALP